MFEQKCFPVNIAKCLGTAFLMKHVVAASELIYVLLYYNSCLSYHQYLVNTLAMHGFGRILTWNVKKLGACLRQDNVEQLKEVVCVVLQSANIVALQEAENLDLSCLPCATVLKDEYEWPGSSANDEFRILVKTRHSRSFRYIFLLF